MKFPALVCSFVVASAAASHEVIVYSYLTEDGKRFGSPGADRPVKCFLSGGGYRELGNPARGEETMDPKVVRSMLIRAIGRNHFEAAGDEDVVEAVVLSFTWGYMNPIINRDAVGGEWFVNAAEMLNLVGGRALSQTLCTESMRSELSAAAREERYFVIVSAYEFASYARPGAMKLLWSTQMSVPSVHLTQSKALPMLLAAGAPLFGRETPWPKRIDLKVAGILNF